MSRGEMIKLWDDPPERSHADTIMEEEPVWEDLNDDGHVMVMMWGKLKCILSDIHEDGMPGWRLEFDGFSCYTEAKLFAEKFLKGAFEQEASKASGHPIEGEETDAEDRTRSGPDDPLRGELPRSLPEA